MAQDFTFYTSGCTITLSDSRGRNATVSPFAHPPLRLAFRPGPMRTFIRLLTNLVASHLAVLLAWVRLQAARVRHAFGERK